MIGKFVSFAAWLQPLTAKVTPIALLSVLPADIFQYILLGVGGLAIFIVICIICSIVRFLKKWTKRRAIRKTFGIINFSKFKVRRMGRPGSKHYTDNGSNCFEINLPHWKFANEDGSRQNKRVNKVIWEKCHLWLHDGQKTYILTTADPYEMIYLVHTLRDKGIDIAPCKQETAKQEEQEKAKKSLEESMAAIIESVDNNNDRFAELCRQRLVLRGYNLSEAPKNNFGLNFFFQKKAHPVMVKCHLVPRDYLVGVEEMKGVKEGAESLFAESCLFITTGRLSVAAVGFALTNGIDIITDERLVEIMEEAKPIPVNKMFTRWELTNDDLKNLLSEDLLSKIF